MEADKQGGRRHLVITLGRKRSAVFYIWSLIVTYVWIILTPFILDVPFTILFGLLSLPLALMAGKKVLSHYDQMEKLIPALGLNVGVVVLTDLFLGIGYFF